MLLDKDCGIYLKTVDSTNTYCKRNEIPSGYWVLSEEQTAGRGRQGRTWISLGEEKIIFSGKFILSEIKSSISLLSLFIGSAVLKTLHKHFPHLISEISLKWPNDIFLRDKKVSGILIESEFIDGKSIFIAGIGINLFGKESISTSEYLSNKALGKEIKASILYSLIEFINEVEMILQKSTSVQAELDWVYDRSFLKNKKIETIQNGEKFSGIVIGYDRNGFLSIKKEDENVVSILDTGPGFKVL